MLVVGVGNRDRGDDGAGLVAASRLGAAAGVPVALLDAAGDGTVLLDAWRGADTVIVLDAMRSGAAAGTVRRLDAGPEHRPAEVAAHLGAGALGVSTHGLGVAEAVALSDALGRLPRRLIILGIEGACFDAGADLSPEVARAVDGAVRLGLEEVADVPRPAR
ncbi:MAG TPA: hydrogenase maturation protease [bacterium]|nr:hydrogenase maturation protease [bacterium]